MSIGDNIRRLREQHGLTQRELGDIAGVSDKAVSTWELGSKAPRMGAVARLAAYFGIPKSAILDEQPVPVGGFATAFERLCRSWNLTPEQVERELALPHGRLLQLRRGETPTEEELSAFIEYFHAPREILMGDIPLTEEGNVLPVPLRPSTVPPSSRRQSIPVLGRVPAGVPIEAVTDVVEYLDLSPELEDDGYEYFGLLVTGDSMYPEYRDGDIVVLRAQETAETGDDVVAYIGGSDATLKRLTRTEGGIQLRPMNPEYPVRSFTRQEILSLPVTIGGVVVEQRRRRRR